MSQGFINAQNITLPLAVAQGGTGVTTSTGTGSVVLSNSPTFDDSIAFGDTSKGIIGTATNNDADAGYVGQYLESILLIGSAVSLSSLTPANITSLSITAGDWNVWGEVWFDAAGTTVASSFAAAINTVSATFPTVPAAGTSVVCAYFSSIAQATAGVEGTINVGPCRVSLASTTTYYLNTRVGFSTSTMAAYGKLCARRIR